ncbi:CCA tRNA nucleotidyltransferase [bacterium]|nr:CCA tRNA nucleotidyltransferase [bacterium]
MNSLEKFIQTKINNDEFFIKIKPYIKNMECYLVGGYIRDLLNNEKSCDRDLIVHSGIAKNLALDIANNTNGHFIPLDEENQIYRVVMPDKKNYFDISAMLDDNLYKDINRRDLTINSLVYDLNNDKIIDKNDSLNDFKNHILRTSNLENFIDDPLRMLRIYRFCAKYNFNISDETETFIRKNKELLNNPAKERINTEIMKLFESKYSDIALTKMDKTGILSSIFPVVDEIKKIPPNTHHHLSLLNHSIETVRQIQRHFDNYSQNVKNSLCSNELGTYSRLAFLKLAGFLHDIGKPDTWTIEKDTGRHRFLMHDDVGSKKVVPILKNLKFSKKQISYIQKMIKFHIYPSSLVWQENVGSKARLKFYRKMYPFCIDIITLAKSDRLSAMGPDVTVDMIIKNLSDLSVLLEECLDFDSSEAKPKPFLNGEEVMKITGLPQSKELGNYIKTLYIEQLEGNIATKEDAIKFLEDMKISNKLNTK